MTVIRVLVADDQKVVRDGLCALLGMMSGIEVIGAAVDGADAIRQARRHPPDVVLMDLHMPNCDGVEATRRIVRDQPSVRVVVLTAYCDDERVFGALGAGARGYLTKDANAEEIERAIRAVADGRTHLDPEIQQRLITAALTRRTNATVPDDLTSREVEVLKLIAGGLSNAEIAASLVLSAATVKTHINHIFQKTGARDRAQAVRYAYDHGLS
jgi:DNA-binding NarL/FixJ family response regulator